LQLFSVAITVFTCLVIILTEPITRGFTHFLLVTTSVYLKICHGGLPKHLLLKSQTVSRRLPTAAARVQTQVWSCGIL
jgi:hypothetical protein